MDAVFTQNFKHEIFVLKKISEKKKKISCEKITLFSNFKIPPILSVLIGQKWTNQKSVFVCKTNYIFLAVLIRGMFRGTDAAQEGKI